VALLGQQKANMAEVRQSAAPSGPSVGGVVAAEDNHMEDTSNVAAATGGAAAAQDVKQPNLCAAAHRGSDLTTVYYHLMYDEERGDVSTWAKTIAKGSTLANLVATHSADLTEKWTAHRELQNRKVRPNLKLRFLPVTLNMTSTPMRQLSFPLSLLHIDDDFMIVDPIHIVVDVNSY